MINEMQAANRTSSLWIGLSSTSGRVAQALPELCVALKISE